MGKKLTSKQMEARYEALNEASEHLHLDWTSSALESSEGLVMADWLKEQAFASNSKAGTNGQDYRCECWPRLRACNDIIASFRRGVGTTASVPALRRSAAHVIPNTFKIIPRRCTINTDAISAAGEIFPRTINDHY